MLESTATARPGAPALTDRNGTLTYEQLVGDVQAAASGLIGLGLTRGDRVAVWLPKRREKVIGMYAAMRAGGIAVPVNSALKAPQVAHILRDSGAKVLVTTAARAADLAREPQDLASLGEVVTLDGSPPPARAGVTVRSWEQLLSAPAVP